jgi:hypothetical protein
MTHSFEIQNVKSLKRKQQRSEKKLFEEELLYAYFP